MEESSVFADTYNLNKRVYETAAHLPSHPVCFNTCLAVLVLSDLEDIPAKRTEAVVQCSSTYVYSNTSLTGINFFSAVKSAAEVLHKEKIHTNSTN